MVWSWAQAANRAAKTWPIHWGRNTYHGRGSKRAGRSQGYFSVWVTGTIFLFQPTLSAKTYGTINLDAAARIADKKYLRFRDECRSIRIPDMLLCIFTFVKLRWRLLGLRWVLSCGSKFSTHLSTLGHAKYRHLEYMISSVTEVLFAYVNRNNWRIFILSALHICTRFYGLAIMIVATNIKKIESHSFPSASKLARPRTKRWKT